MQDGARPQTDCTQNTFCAALPPDTRAQLCTKCHRRVTRAGSVEMYGDFSRHVTLILDGVLSGSTYVGEDTLASAPTLPSFYLCSRGYLFGLDTTFRPKTVEHDYDYNCIEFLTDCCIATFSHGVIKSLFEQNSEFAQAAMTSTIQIMESSCQLSAILRANSVYLTVSYLLRFFVKCNAFLSQQQLANIVARDRSSVSKAMTRIQREDPALWEAHAANRGRKIKLMNPAQ